MKLLVEDYPYPADLVMPYITGIAESLVTDEQNIAVGYVGYCFNKIIDDCVFFLPKVILDKNNLILGKYDPKEEIELKKIKKNTEDYSLIHGLSVWIYRAIGEYRKEKENSTIVYRQSISQLDSAPKLRDATLLDTYLSLIKFANENQDFFTFILKNVHSGYNKINWQKTVTHSQAFFQDGKPFYIKPINKRRQINFDEDLFVIFFTIINYINNKYGFKGKINFGYELITGRQFDNYLKGLGKIRLMQIKSKYFSDKTLLLWDLCYAFFYQSEVVKSSHSFNDYLLVKDFNIVFEVIIDDLIGDKNILPGLKHQYDGKAIDHIYKYESLINADNIYYIGDSKYYKIGNSVYGQSEYKQYTYAKNVIQYNLNILLGDDTSTKEFLPYRDDLTEGYNVTPNFFISAEIPKDNPNYHTDNLKHKEGGDKRSRQFQNRLFDRDTLWLSQYDVNFLFILSLYAAGSHSAKSAFKKKARRLFREAIIDVLNNKYNFYRIETKNINKFVYDHFRQLTGKMYHYGSSLILALELNDPETETILNLLNPFYKLTKFNL